jgi:hypothetical protein
VNDADRKIYKNALLAVDLRRQARGLALREPGYAEGRGADREAAVRAFNTGSWAAPLRDLAGCASADVAGVLDAAAAAHQAAVGRYAAWSGLADDNYAANKQAAASPWARFPSPDPAIRAAAALEAKNAIEPALTAADQADDVLVALIDAYLTL